MIAHELIHRLTVIFSQIRHSVKGISLRIKNKIICQEICQRMTALADIAQIVKVGIIPFFDDIPFFKLKKPHVFFKPIAADIRHLAAVRMIFERLKHFNATLALKVSRPCTVIPPSAEIPVVIHSESL